MRFEHETQSIHLHIRQASRDYEMALRLANVRFDDAKEADDTAPTKTTKN